MSTLSQISERIRKILSLSKSDNANEAANAANLAQKLMQEHKLSEQDVSDLADDGNEVTEISLGTEGFMASWRFALVTVVSRAFFCEAIALRAGVKRRLKIIGRKSDTEVASYVFSFLVKEIERLVAADAEEFADVTESMRSYKDSFRRGAAMGIADKIKRGTAAFSSSSERALVVVKSSQEEISTFMKRKYGEPKIANINVGKKTRNFDERVGMSRGYQAGSEIQIPTRAGEQPALPDKPDPRKPKDVYVRREKESGAPMEVVVGAGPDLTRVSCGKCGGIYLSPSTRAADCPACRENV